MASHVIWPEFVKAWNGAVHLNHSVRQDSLVAAMFMSYGSDSWMIPLGFGCKCSSRFARISLNALSRAGSKSANDVYLGAVCSTGAFSAHKCSLLGVITDDFCCAICSLLQSTLMCHLSKDWNIAAKVRDSVWR